MCDERGGVSDPEFPFALPELGALIAASPRVVPTRADASRANTPTGASPDDSVDRFRSSTEQGIWPPVDFDGEFDALGVDVRALAPAEFSAEDETPFPEVPDWIAAEDRDVFEAFRGFPFADATRHGPFADLPGDFGTEHFGDDGHRAPPRSSDASPAVRVPSSSATREKKRIKTVRPTEEDETDDADDETDDVSCDDEAADNETAMRRMIRESPRYPALLDAYFECATVGASATRVAAAERRKRKLLMKRAARAGDDGTLRRDRTTDEAFADVSPLLIGGGSYDPNVPPESFRSEASSSSSSSSSSKCSQWRDRSARDEAGAARGLGAPPAVSLTPTGVFSPDENRDENRDARSPADARSVDAFMAKCVAELEAYAKDLRATYREAEEACAAFEARVATLGRLTLRDEEDDREEEIGRAATPLSAARATRDGAAATKATDPGPRGVGPSGTPKREVPNAVPNACDALRETLKRKYAASILSLKDEFLKKRKKGKLPAAATGALKRWWRARVVWPYPSEEEKRALGEDTGLDPTQINNWFINQRKRHWHKLFEGGVPPGTEAEARAALAARFGSLQAAVDVARDA